MKHTHVVHVDLLFLLEAPVTAWGPPSDVNVGL